MKILYVGDNRDRQNFGCRATSRALYEIITINNTVSHKVMGNMLGFSDLGVVSLGRLLPSRIYSKVHKNRLNNSLCLLLDGFEKFLGGSPDYVDLDPQKAMRQFLRVFHKKEVLIELHKQLMLSDCVVINGEGDMIFEKPYRRSLLFLLLIIELATKYEKPVHYVNGVISDSPRSQRDPMLFNSCVQQLNKCTSVICRDPDSCELILPFLDKDVICEYIPDALFTWKRYFSGPSFLKPPFCADVLIGHPEYDDQYGAYDFSRPYICIGGSSSAAWNPEKSYEYYMRLVDKFLGLGYPIFLVECCSGDQFLREIAIKLNLPFIPVQTPILGVASIFANAVLFVSGRYHPSILASLGGTPCIFMGSNSKKMTSLQKMLGYEFVHEYPIYPTEYELCLMYERANDIIDEGDALRNKLIESVSTLSAKAMSLVDLI